MLTAITGGTVGNQVFPPVKDVAEPKFVDVKAWRSDVGAENADPLVEALVTAVQGVDVKNVAALRAAIAAIIEQGAPALLPSGEKHPDRTVIKGPSGKPATDLEIEQAQFKIVPPTGFSVTLDMSPDNIVLQES
jgi:hypothetical protein